MICSAARADVVRGEAGDDRLDGGGDNDLLYGGTGSDIFVFTPGSGRDKIMDFEAQDRIDLPQSASLPSNRRSRRSARRAEACI